MKTFVTSLCLLSSTAALASPAVSYTCVGNNAITNEAVAFDVLFAESDIKHGYTNQAITINKMGWTIPEAPATYQMYGATKKNACQQNAEGELYMAGDFQMDLPSEKGVGDFVTTFKFNCGADRNFDVKGVCFLDHRY